MMRTERVIAAHDSSARFERASGVVSCYSRYVDQEGNNNE
jgi:hypothetical protein